MPGIFGKGVLVPGHLAVDVLGMSVLQDAITSSDLVVELGVEVGEPRSKAEATGLLGLSNASGTGDTNNSCRDSISGRKRPCSRGKLRCGGQHHGWHLFKTMLRCFGWAGDTCIRQSALKS